MTIAWAYCRFSSDHQREESIDAQIRAIRDYCGRNQDQHWRKSIGMKQDPPLLMIAHLFSKCSLISRNIPVIW